MTHTSVCDYCKTTITNNNHDWVLVKKEIKKEEDFIKNQM